MKKVIVSLCAVLLVFGIAGCTKDNVKLDLEKIRDEVAELKGKSYELVNVSTALSSSGLFDAAVSIYNYDLKDYNVTEDNINMKDYNYDFILALDTNAKTGYAMVKAAKGKEEALTKELDALFEGYTNLAKDEVQGYTVYIASSDNAKALELMKKEGYSPIYGMLMYLEDAVLEDTLGLKKDLLSEYLVATPQLIVSSSSYLIVKPAEGKTKEVKKALNDYMTKVEEQWKTYLPDQYELVKNRKEEKIGSYLVYIISNDNDAVLKTIKNNIQK